MKRYQIYTIGNADCTELGDGPLAEADSMTDADSLAAEHSRHAYGAAILDTETGSINWGMGWEKS